LAVEEFMFRTALLLLILGARTQVSKVSPSAAWPLRAFVTDLHGRPVSFSAVTLGGELIIRVGGDVYLPRIRPLVRGDTLRAATPASYPLDLSRGAVAFFTSSRDSVRVVVGRNPFGETDRVAAQGRRLTVRQENNHVVIDAQ
jgi:hypothetical protein